MTGSPLKSILPVPGSSSTSEPSNPLQRDPGAESGLVPEDLVALQIEREARTQLHLIEAARARFEAEACEREGHLYPPGRSRCVHCGHLDTSWIQMTTVTEPHGFGLGVAAVTLVAVVGFAIFAVIWAVTR